MNLIIRGVYFGLLLLTYPLNLLHEYSHYFMARLLGGEVVNFKITVYDGETEFITPYRLDACLILLAPLMTFFLVYDLMFMLNIKFGGVLFVLLLFMLPSPRDIKAIIQALAYKRVEAFKNVEGDLIG